MLSTLLLMTFDQDTTSSGISNRCGAGAGVCMAAAQRGGDAAYECIWRPRPGLPLAAQPRRREAVP